MHIAVDPGWSFVHPSVLHGLSAFFVLGLEGFCVDETVGRSNGFSNAFRLTEYLVDY